MIKNRYCKKCGHKVKKETTKEEQFNPYEFGAVSALNQDSK